MEATASARLSADTGWIARLGRSIKRAFTRAVRAVGRFFRAAGATVVRVARATRSGLRTAGAVVWRGTRWVGRKSWLGLTWVGRGASWTVAELVSGVQTLFTTLGLLVLIVGTGVVMLGLLVEPIRIFARWLSTRNRGPLGAYWNDHRPLNPFGGAREQAQIDREVARTERQLADEIVVPESDASMVFINEPETAVGPDEVDAVFEARELLIEATKDPMSYDWDSEVVDENLLGIYSIIASHADDPKVRALFKGREYAARMYLEHPDTWTAHIKRINALMQQQLRGQQHIYPVKWLREGFDAQVECQRSRPSVEV